MSKRSINIEAERLASPLGFKNSNRYTIEISNDGISVQTQCIVHGESSIKRTKIRTLIARGLKNRNTF